MNKFLALLILTCLAGAACAKFINPVQSRLRRDTQAPPAPEGAQARNRPPIEDDFQFAPSENFRTYRQSPPAYLEEPLDTKRSDLPVAESHGYGHGHGGYKKGIVGPVYTFVKTDYDGNFKWGVRHVAGHQYAGRR